MTRSDSFRSGQPSQRQLRVGELVRHAIAETFARGEAGAELDGVLISVAEVRMSPDLKHATVLLAPLVVGDSNAVIKLLNRSSRSLRGKISPALRQMRSIPELRFRLDTRFEDDERIDTLLRSADVSRDLGAPDADPDADDGKGG